MPSVLSTPWLPPAPPDFRQRCAALDSRLPTQGAAVQFLASHALTPPMSASLGKALRRLKEQGADLAPLAPLKLVLLGGATLDLLADELPAAAARHGVAIELVLSPYGQIIQ